MDATADGSGLCLPYDVLHDVLSRLQPHAIARIRTVCRAWRAIVDAYGLLPRFFRSRVFPGVFTNHFGCRDESYFLAPPASRSSGADKSEFRRPLFWHGWARVTEHCNSLLLLYDETKGDTYVCNPATIRCAPLPRSPDIWPHRRIEGMFLAFDPAVSLHYEVYRVYMVSRIGRMYSINALGSEEPRTMIVQSAVFWSKTEQWEMREFVPGHCAPSHLYNVEGFARDINWPSAHYWRWSLSVACENGVLMILHCSKGTYDMVQLPGDLYRNAGKRYQLPRRSLLPRYEKRVRYAELNKDLQLRIWVLTRSCDDQLGWTLAHEADLSPHVCMMQHNSLKIEQWVTWDMMSQVWNKDEDNFIEVDKGVVGQMKLKQTYGGIIGLHPHKDVLLLDIGGRAVAYHINTSRMQYLRQWLLREPEEHGSGIDGAFPYRPCYADALPANKIPYPPSILDLWKHH